MERDSVTSSIWQTSIASYPAKVKFLPNGLFDVVIVGGGITGISLAILLQEAGKKCLLIEAHQLGFGTTSGTTAHINTFLENPYHKIAEDFSEEGARQVSLAVQDAVNLIRKNISGFHIDCDYSLQPGYVYAEDEKQVEELDKIVAYSRSVGVDVNFSDGKGFPFPYHKLALFRDQAQFHPLKYIFGLAKEFEKAGGTIVQYCRMEKLDKDHELFTLITDIGNIRARQVVYATHTPPGVNILHTLLAPYRSYVLAAELAIEDYPPGLVYDMHDPYHYFRIHQVKGRRYLIIGGGDHKTGNFSDTSKLYKDLQVFLSKKLPIKKIVYTWSSQLYEPADGLGYIGELPGESENVFVATGFAGNGMVYSHISALVLSDLILREKESYGNIFSPKRVKPVASFSNFVRENADVVQELVTGFLPKEKLDAASDLKPGEGRIVDYEGKKMGLYRDPADVLYAVNPVCPHMKCMVQWNSTEKSWDCPCHGSRFSVTGELLNGPARHNLEVYSLQKQSSL
jgi:glycine/D-amino acid oxidase-like deaminating enzyme/nitrite reductase/ring-hydroxylating ferredoxin subunit